MQEKRAKKAGKKLKQKEQRSREPVIDYQEL
jgi:hypothetical protein